MLKEEKLLTQRRPSWMKGKVEQTHWRQEIRFTWCCRVTSLFFIVCSEQGQLNTTWDDGSADFQVQGSSIKFSSPTRVISFSYRSTTPGENTSTLFSRRKLIFFSESGRMKVVTRTQYFALLFYPIHDVAATCAPFTSLFRVSGNNNKLHEIVCGWLLAFIHTSISFVFSSVFSISVSQTENWKQSFWQSSACRRVVWIANFVSTQIYFNCVIWRPSAISNRR